MKPKRRRAPGGGRKPLPEPVERHTITLLKSHADYLRTIDPKISQAIRKLLKPAGASGEKE